MELREFVGLDPKQIRRDKELMQLYVDFYKAAFSFEPNCKGCSFKSGLAKLKRSLTEKNTTFDKKTMDTKTFTLKKQYRLKILRYSKNGKMHRTYGHNMTEAFARELVAAGRGDVFLELPSSTVPIETKSKYETMDYMKEMMPLYNEIRSRTGKTAKSKKKDDIIAFLKSHEG